MKIGLAKEIKHQEYRVGLTPGSASEYIAHGHTVLVEKSAGAGTGFSDEEYRNAGCRIVDDKKALFDESDMIVKVKEPLEEEYELFHAGQILFTYLHLAADKPLTQALLRRKVSAVAYETIVEADGSIPLLMPMSQIAGRLSIQEGAKYLEKNSADAASCLAAFPVSPKDTWLSWARAFPAPTPARWLSDSAHMSRFSTFPHGGSMNSMPFTAIASRLFMPPAAILPK